MHRRFTPILLPLVTAIFAIVCAGLRADPTIHLLPSAARSAQARFEIADGAEKELLQMVYVFQDDESGYANAAVLRERARNGVKVCLLIDSFSAGNRISSAILQHLQDAGVEVKLFHPFSLSDPFEYLRRMHDKLLLQDGKVLVTGGRNVGNHYYGVNDEAWRDLDIAIESPEVGADARRYFYQIWNSRHAVKPWLGRIPPAAVKAAERTLDLALAKARIHPLVSPADGSGWKNAGHTFEAPVEFISFDFNRAQGRGGQPHHVLNLLKSATRRIEIVTPYFAPPWVLEWLLRQKVKEGVEVRIVTNSESANNQKWVAKYYRANLARYAKMGFEIVEMDGVTTHTKALVVDDTAVVGTFNVDGISWFKNLEMGVVIRKKEVADHLHDLIERDYVQEGQVVAKNHALMPGAQTACVLWRLLLTPLRNHL